MCSYSMSSPSVASLPQPVGRQREVLYLPPTGHCAVLGTAGSGKTTLAILRSLFLADKQAEHGGPTLLATFNRCLVTYMRYLAAGSVVGISVENYHKFARGYLSSRGRLTSSSISSPEHRSSFIRLALRDAHADGVKSTVLDRSHDFIDEEFQWIQGHGIASLEDYVAAERIGRSSTRVRRAERPALFNLYERYLDRRSARGKLYDWSDLASGVVREVASDNFPRRYQHVVIDEGQDFSPEMLRSLAAIIPKNGSLTYFGDIAQQVYGLRMSWREAGLNVKQVWRFRENYRNTKQVSQLALALAELPGFPDDPDLVEPTAPTADGPLPALVCLSDLQQERKFVVSRAIKHATTGTVAILFRTRGQESEWLQHFPSTGTKLHRDLEYWPTGPGLFFGTYHAAKGLEFDTVFLPLLSEENWPHPEDVECFGEQEALERNSRLLYVGITRARSTLVMTFAGQMTRLLPDRQSLYQRSHG